MVDAEERKCLIVYWKNNSDAVYIYTPTLRTVPESDGINGKSTLAARNTFSLICFFCALSFPLAHVVNDQHANIPFFDIDLLMFFTHCNSLTFVCSFHTQVCLQFTRRFTTWPFHLFEVVATCKACTFSISRITETWKHGTASFSPETKSDSGQHQNSKRSAHQTACSSCVNFLSLSFQLRFQYLLGLSDEPNDCGHYGAGKRFDVRQV